MRHTGGTALGEISTRSSPASRAILIASYVGRTPTCEPSAPITRTSRARIRSFMRINLLSIRNLHAHDSRVPCGQKSIAGKQCSIGKRKFEDVRCKGVTDEHTRNAADQLVRRVLAIKFDLQIIAAKGLAAAECDCFNLLAGHGKPEIAILLRG